MVQFTGCGGMCPWFRRMYLSRPIFPVNETSAPGMFSEVMPSGNIRSGQTFGQLLLAKECHVRVNLLRREEALTARFLLITQSAAGHVAPCLPLARRLVDRGHTVGWCAGRRFRHAVESTGAAFLPLPNAMDPRDENLYDLLPALKGRRGIRQMKVYMDRIFLASAEPCFHLIRRTRRHFPTDVLLADSTCYGAIFFAEKRGLPCAAIGLVPPGWPSRDTAPSGLGILPGSGAPARVRNLLLNRLVYRLYMRGSNEQANRLRRRLGLPRLAPSLAETLHRIPDLYLQPTTPAFEYPRGDLSENVRFIGPLLPAQGSDFAPPSWWHEVGRDRPIVLVTQGTLATDSTLLIRPVITALADEAVLVVAASFTPGESEQLPRNVRTERFIPFQQLLPHVSVMITNGGYGAVQLALAHGVPVIVAGDTEDKAEVGARVEWSGAGINLRSQSPSPERIRRAVRAVLRTPSYRENATRIARDFARHDAPATAAALLEGLADKRRDAEP